MAGDPLREIGPEGRGLGSRQRGEGVALIAASRECGRVVGSAKGERGGFGGGTAVGLEGDGGHQDSGSRGDVEVGEAQADDLVSGVTYQFQVGTIEIDRPGGHTFFGIVTVLVDLRLKGGGRLGSLGGGRDWSGGGGDC